MTADVVVPRLVAPLLVVPDPRRETVPAGWWDQVARPTIERCDDWATLDGWEAGLRAVIGWCEAVGRDVLEFEKALRVIEVRRGSLLAPRRQGERTDLQPLPRVGEVDESPQTMARWRKIAEHWPEVEAVLRAATDSRQVSQAAVLRLIDPSERPDGLVDRQWCSVALHDLRLAARTLRNRLAPSERATLAVLLVADEET